MTTLTSFYNWLKEETVKPELVIKSFSDRAEINLLINNEIAGWLILEEIKEELGYPMKKLLQPQCYSNWEDACNSFNKKFRVFMVGQSGVLPIPKGVKTNIKNIPGVDLRNQGYGLQMYIAAAKWAAHNNGVIIPSGCLQFGGSTSPEALRVWQSSRFKQQVHLYGYVAYAKI
jgi:hypothetical protein